MKIVKRCKWCVIPHLMDSQGNPIQGRTDDPSVMYSDGLCLAADKIANAELDKRIAQNKLDNTKQ